MRIYDQSVQDEPDSSVTFNIFWPEADMPDARCGDVIIAFSAKVRDNRRRGLSITFGTVATKFASRSKITSLHIHYARTKRPIFTFLTPLEFPDQSQMPPEPCARLPAVGLLVALVEQKASLSVFYIAPSTRNGFRPHPNSKP